MLIDGEKYACDACVRGHRVSNCQHSDRPLNHINKKGRPVTQCPHCRSLRKSRASHVRCECGDKPHSKDDCPHLKHEGLDPSLRPHVCCCSHGQRCSCALKKESPLGCLPEADTTENAGKPRLATTHSDSNMTIFANGHHKPCHHKNHEASHQRGAPYKIPRPHSIHGHQSLAQRSMEQLPTCGTLDHSYNQFLDSLRGFQQEDRQIKSESGSPAPGQRQRSRTLNSGLQSLTVGYSPFTLSNPSSPLPGLNDFTSNPAIMTSMNTPSLTVDDSLQGLSTTSTEGSHIDWSTYFGPSIASQQFSVPEAFTSPPTSNPNVLSAFDTNAPSSGAVSDVEESTFTPYAASNPGYAESNPGYAESTSYAQSLPDQSRPDLYRINSAASFVHSGPTSTPLGSAFTDHGENICFPEPSGLDVESLFHGSATTLSEIDRSSSGAGSPLGPGVLPSESSHLQPGTIHGFTVENAQKMAHPTGPAGGLDTNSANFPHKTVSDAPPSPWAAIHDENLTAFDPRDNLNGSVWMD